MQTGRQTEKDIPKETKKLIDRTIESKIETKRHIYIVRNRLAHRLMKTDR